MARGLDGFGTTHTCLQSSFMRVRGYEVAGQRALGLALSARPHDRTQVEKRRLVAAQSACLESGL